jgi:hypothetical protein
MVGMKTLNNLQLLILKFNFVIEYKERWRNTVADALSRAVQWASSRGQAG